MSILDAEHVVMADDLVKQFLAYSVALGLSKPALQAQEPRVSKLPTPPDAKGAPIAEPQEVKQDCSAPMAAQVGSVGAPVVPGEQSGGSRRPSNRLVVVRADGSEIRNARGSVVFCEALRAAGLGKVSELGLIFSGEPIVSKVRSIKYPGASHALEGWYVLTHSNNEAKAEKLRQVSKALGLNWKVQVLLG